MERIVKMKQIFIFSFLFLCSILIVSSYSAGEKLNLSYSNITNVTPPCLLINQHIYLSGNIPIGNNNCTITYYGNVTEQIIIDNGGSSGGGGRSYRRTKICTPDWECTKWGNCQSNSRSTRGCIDSNGCNITKPSENRGCYYVQGETAEITPIQEYIQEEMGEIEQTQPTEEQENIEGGMALGWWIAIGVFIVIILALLVMFFLRRNEYN